MHIAALVFIDIAIIMIVARVFGRAARAVGQPAVVGEIIAGIALGPSLLGLLPGDLDQRLFPPEVLPYLSVLAQLGLVLFMFIVGLELDMLLIRGREKLAGPFPRRRWCCRSRWARGWRCCCTPAMTRRPPAR